MFGKSPGAVLIDRCHSKLIPSAGLNLQYKAPATGRLSTIFSKDMIVARGSIEYGPIAQFMACE